MRLVSILGDSISTFHGYNPANYAVFYDEEKQRQNGLLSVYDTWWAKVNQALNAYLCVNNSYSGSKASGFTFPAANCLERIENLRTKDHWPDIILVYIGFNDFGKGVKPVRNTETTPYPDLLFFDDAYDRILTTIERLYPQTHIVCGTLMKTRIANYSEWIFPDRYDGVPFEEYNNVIRKVCRKHNCLLADLDALEATVETLDGSHPTIRGHQEFANAWLSFILHSDWYFPTIKQSINDYVLNKSSDTAVYNVFHSLANERVLLPINENGQMLLLNFDGKEIIALFTSPHQIPDNEPILTKPVYVEDIMGIITTVKKNIIINPFDDIKSQFVVPFPAFEKMLLPLIRNKE